MTQIEISEEEFGANLEFIIDLCHRERMIWKIRSSDGQYFMCVPVLERAAPVPDDVMSQVEEFKKEFLANQA